LTFFEKGKAMFKRMLFVLSLAVLCTPVWAQNVKPQLTSCHCYCGKNVSAPCGDDECKAACGYREPEFDPGELELMPSTLPFEVTSYLAGKAALERGDYDTALRELQKSTGANPCFAPAHEQMGDLFLRTQNRWACRLGSEPMPCNEVAAYSFYWAANGCDGKMQGMSEAELAQLRARAEPLYDAAYQQRSRRLAEKVYLQGRGRLESGDYRDAEQEFRYVVGLFTNGAVRATREDGTFSLAYDGLAEALEAQNRIADAIAALEAQGNTPFFSFYGRSPVLQRSRQEKLDRLKRKQGLCQLVMYNDTYDDLDLYINDSNSPACRALAAPRPPAGYDGPMAVPPYPIFCVTHVREGTYVMSAKRPGAEFFTKASGAIWCPVGAVREWHTGK
jgi:hypothetical protein